MLEAPRRVRLQVEGQGPSSSTADGGADDGQGDGDGEVEDGETIGPFNEGALLSLKCTAEGGKPTPKVREKLF